MDREYIEAIVRRKDGAPVVGLDIIKKAEESHRLTREEIVILLTDREYEEELFAAADRVRKKYVGDEVHLRALIEFSNICKQNCLYCGLRGQNGAVNRYRLEPDVIIQFARDAAAYGFKTVVLQSGEDDYYTMDRMQYIIKEIKALGVAITLSIGEKSRQEYQAYREVGADRFLLRIETTDPAVYAAMHPQMSYTNRRRCLKDLKDLGFEVGTGCLVGLPGQTPASLAGDILFFQAIDADMIGLGPFIPNPETPLKEAAGGSFQLSRKVMAITRLLLPDANIPATTAMETLDPQGRILALQSGANVIMPNMTEGDYRRFYTLYPGKVAINDTPLETREKVMKKIASIGRTVADDCGFRKKSLAGISREKD